MMGLWQIALIAGAILLALFLALGLASGTLNIG